MILSGNGSIIPMTTLSPQTLTKAEQSTLLAVTAAHPRDHLTFSFALGTGLRLAEIVGLDVADVNSPAGQPKSRVRIRAVIAKGGQATVFRTSSQCAMTILSALTTAPSASIR